MLDKWILAKAKNPLILLAKKVKAYGITPNQITCLGFGFAILSALFIIAGEYIWGLVFILLNRGCDGLDGTLARLTKSTDLGAFLDITLDFLFYSMIPLAFALNNPQVNALPAACVIFSFVGTGSSFLAFAIIAAKRRISSLHFPQKSFYYLGGLTEAVETIMFFIASCLFPAYFPIFAYIFTALCLITTSLRIIFGWKNFRSTPLK